MDSGKSRTEPYLQKSQMSNLKKVLSSAQKCGPGVRLLDLGVRRPRLEVMKSLSSGYIVS